MRWLLVGAMALSACRAGPKLDGQSLWCDGGSCPRGMRCVDGICLNNSPPEVTPFGAPTVVAEGTEVSRTVEATDPDGDELTFTWSLISGPDVTLSAEGAAVELTPSDLGIYVIQVAVDDGFVESPVTADLTVVVQPAGATGAVYVAEDGASADCGSYDAPCATVTDALRENPGVGVVLVAAAAAPYRECLGLDGTIEVRGGYERATWAQRDELRAFTRIECYRCSGVDCLGCAADAERCAHELAGSSGLRDLTVTTAHQGPAELAVTAVVTGTVDLQGVDVEMPACDDGTSVGVAVLGATATLDRVDIRSTSLGGAQEAIGLLMAGGSTTVTGELADPAAPLAGERGRILVSAPGSLYAVPVALSGGTANLDRMLLEGRYAASMSGVEARSTSVTLSSSRVELVGAGTQSMAGAHVRDCGADTACLCWFSGCGQLPQPSSGTSAAQLLDSTFVLRSDVDVFGLAPCSASAVFVESNDVTVTGCHLELQEGFSRGVGVALVAPDVVATPNVVSSNQIDVGDAVASPLCDLLMEPITVLGLLSASFGVWSDSGTGAQVLDNAITMGSNSMTSCGFAHTGGGGVTYAGNEVRVGFSDTVRADLAAGAALGLTATESIFAENQIVVGRGADLSYGLALLSLAPWRVENNLVYGGDAGHSIALITAPLAEGLICPGNTPWPRVLHNTFHAGGLGGATGTSLAYQRTECFGLGFGPYHAILVNNLFDAGAGARRVAVEELWPFDQARYAFGAEGNLVQVSGTAAGTGLMTAVGEFGAATDPWALVLQDSAELVGVEIAAEVTEHVYGVLPDRPTATWGDKNFNSRTSPLVAGRGFVATVVDGGLAFHSAVVPTGLGETVPLSVSAVAQVEEDIVLVAGVGGTTGLWRMLLRDDGSYATPKPLITDFPLDAGTMIDGTVNGLVVLATGGRAVAGHLAGDTFAVDVLLHDGGPVEGIAAYLWIFGIRDTFVVAGGNAVYARATGNAWSDASTAATTCAAGHVRAVAFGASLADGENLVVACDDGTIERCQPGTPPTCAAFATGLGAALSGVAVRGGRILALARDDNEVRQFLLDGTAEPTTNSAVLSGDLVQRRVATGTTWAVDGSTLQDGFVEASTPCVFGGGEDLHLTVANDCATAGVGVPSNFDGVTVSLPTDDFDGDTRATPPHVGADEP